MTSRMLLEYDGTGFAGWARQPGQRTVQQQVEQALSTIRREEVALTVAGRTDRGVHAWGQVCSYEHEAVDPQRLNALLPRDVAVLDCNPAADGFSARHDAISRTYCYRLRHRRARSVWHDTRSLWHGWELDTDALRACADAVVGTHDFTAFTPSEGYHTRFDRKVLRAEWRADGDLLELWITADTFMRQMNRILVGTMLEVATGRRTLEDFVALLAGAPRSQAGPTAAPHGLALASVGYHWTPDHPRRAGIHRSLSHDDRSTPVSSTDGGQLTGRRASGSPRWRLRRRPNMRLVAQKQLRRRGAGPRRRGRRLRQEAARSMLVGHRRSPR